MKQYRQFLKEMPTKTIVFAFGRCNPPTNGHGLLVKVVKHIADTNKADYVIYASRTQDKKKNPLSVDKKIHYLNLMFPHTNFRPATDKERTFIEVAKALNAKYKNIIMIAGSDRVSEYERLLNTYNGKEFNYDSIQVISAGERDPDSDDVSGMSASKMRALASEGNYQGFKKGLPTTMRDIDGKRLMNDVRQGMGMDVIKERFKFNVDELREKYFRKEIFNIGDIVESNSEPFEILDRGSNYLVVVNSNGETSRKWIQDVVMSEEQTLFTDAQFRTEPDEAPEQISFKGFTTNNLNRAPGAAKAFQRTIQNMGEKDPIAVLNALKATDEYLSLTTEDVLRGGKENAEELTAWNAAHLKAKRVLEHMGEFSFHAEYWHTYKDRLDKAVYAVRIVKADDDSDSITESTMLDPNKDKIKVAKMIATILGVDDAEKSSNPENLVNSALRKTKSLNKDSLKIVSKMLKLADEVGIKYDHKAIKNIQKSNLTEEQTQLAMERAERYGRRYPNPIDTQWALSEGKAPPITIRKGEVGSAASLRPDDEKKLTATSKGVVPEEKVVNQPSKLPTETETEIENIAKTGHKNPNTPKPGKGESEISHVGSSLTPGKAGTDAIDRMKVEYMREDEQAIDDKIKELANHDDCCDHDESEEEIDKMINSLTDDDIMDAYDDDEFAVVDSETGEECEEEKPVKEEVIMEVLSKIERMKARLRFAKNRPKLERARMLALRKHSDSKKINKRARHLAVNLMRKKLLRGKSAQGLSTNEKERIDRIIEKKKKVIGRMAMKLTQRVRQTEKDRLSHKHFTKD